MGKNVNLPGRNKKANFSINTKRYFTYKISLLDNVTKLEKQVVQIKQVEKRIKVSLLLRAWWVSREMNALKAIQYCFPLTKPTHTQADKSNGRRRSTICFSNSDGAESNTSIPDGDKRKQELLAQIAMLHAQKVRLTDFLDERSINLTQFAENANAEFDAIGENALKELDDAGTRIMEKLESRMQDFEETAELNRQEIESSQKILEEFQEQIVRDKNEGLFFMNLRQKTPQKKAETEDTTQKLRQLEKETASRRTRRNIYLALMLLLILAVGNAVFAKPEVEWQKVGALVFIMFGLVAQLIYENSLSTTTDEPNKEE